MNRRLLIPLGAGVAVLVLWFVALWGPQGSALSSARKRANDAVAQRETLRDQLKRLQDSRRDQPLKQSQLETLRVAIPDDPNLAQFILDANDAASIAGIDFLSITPTPPTGQTQATPPTGQAQATPPTGQAQATTPTTVAGAAAGPVAVRIAMTISGGYFQVLDFMNRLNGLPRLVVIDGVAMTAPVGTQLQVSLQERIFTTSVQPVSGATTGASTTTTTPGATTTTRAGGG